MSQSTSAPQQRVVASGKSQHSFDEALEVAADKVPRGLRGLKRPRLEVTFEIRASNPHIAEFWAIIKQK